jgi:heme-degrading monooxygenase HmoA
LSTRTVVFRTYPVDESRAEYYAAAEQLFKIAAAMPGFVAAKTFAAPDGEELTVVEFESDEALNAWRRHAEHLAAQKSSGRFFSDYRITVFGDPLRDYGIKHRQPYQK